MKYYLIVGEASGDLHASRLMRSLKKYDELADFRFFGGDLMAAEGGTRVKHYKELAYMGFVPVVLHLGTIIKFIPYPIVVGFTSGIAVTIFTTQIKDLFGLSIDKVPSDFIEKWWCYICNFGTIDLSLIHH